MIMDCVEVNLYMVIYELQAFPISSQTCIAKYYSFYLWPVDLKNWNQSKYLKSNKGSKVFLNQ